ncbi:MAG: DUF3667 domain-containing protein [Bacteroidota bacterium]
MNVQLICKNCGHEFTGQYCPACGQKHIPERWNLKRLFRSAFTNVFNIEKGFFFTFKELFLRPGKVMGEYLDGRTTPYTNPFRYMILAAAISVFLMISSGVWELQVNNIIQSYKDFGMISSEADEIRMRKSMSFVTKFMNFMPLILLPFIALSSRLFIGKKLYYAEHFIMVAFLMAQSTIYSLLLTSIAYFFPNFITWVMAGGFLFATIVFGQAFHGLFKKSWLESLALGLVVYIMGFIFFFLIIGVLAFVLGVLAAIIYKMTKG